MIIGTAVFAAVFLTGVRLALRIPVRDYYRVSKKTFVIPDIHGGFVAQGMCYDEDSSSIFLTGYQNDDQASPIYVKSKDSDSFKCVRMMMPNGEPSHNHAGGIAVNDDHVFVAGGFDHCLYVYSKNDILNAADGANIKCSGTFMAEASDDDYMQIAFTTIHDGMLYLGEFYREQNYQTLPSHKLTTSGGDYNQALVLAYPLDDSAEFGVSSKSEAAYSITDLIQGMCIGGDKIYLSASYGIGFKQVYFRQVHKRKILLRDPS